MTPLNGSQPDLSVNHAAVLANNGSARDDLGAGLLRKLRATQHLTQADVADVLCVSQERVSAFERGGVGRAQIGTLRRYIEALGGQLRVEVALGDERFQVT